MRLFFAPLIVEDIAREHYFQYDTLPKPNGIAKVFDITWLSEPWVYPGILWVLGALLGLYVLNWGLHVVLPLITTISVLVHTLGNSQGAIHHSHQIIALVLLAQTLVLYGFTIRKWVKKTPFDFPNGLTLRSYLLYYSQGAILGTYVVAALSKFLNSKGMWVWNSPYIALDLVKSKRQYYYKKLDSEFAGVPELAEWVAANPMISRFFLGGAFFLEALCLIALRSRPWAFFVGLSLIALHKGIFYTMNLKFFYNEMLLLIFLVNLPYWFTWAGKKLGKKETC